MDPSLPPQNQDNNRVIFGAHDSQKHNSLRRRLLSWSSIKLFFTTRPSKKQLMIVGVGGLGILIAGMLILKYFGPMAPEPDPEPEVVSGYTPPPAKFYSELTGLEVEEALSNRPVTSIMIENSIDARPQSSLSEAGIVFEAIAEGGITRFLALYQEAQPADIGPVRSARPYYVEWAAGFDAGYVHSGGSNEAIALIGALGVEDMDHGRNSSFFDRVSHRFAPHNVFTSMARLDQLRESRGFSTSSDFEGFARYRDGDEKPAGRDGATKIEFDISSFNYNTSYTYDTENNYYPRSMAGTAHVDNGNGSQVSPNVVVALITTFGKHADGVHSQYGVLGSGEVYVFQDGTIEKGTWEKVDKKEPLKFKKTNGEPLKLNPGRTWITAIQSGDRVTYTP